jgi:hypothetical protein
VQHAPKVASEGEAPRDAHRADGVQPVQGGRAGAAGGAAVQGAAAGQLQALSRHLLAAWPGAVLHLPASSRCRTAAAAECGLPPGMDMHHPHHRPPSAPPAPPGRRSHCTALHCTALHCTALPTCRRPAPPPPLATAAAAPPPPAPPYNQQWRRWPAPGL